MNIYVQPNWKFDEIAIEEYGKNKKFQRQSERNIIWITTMLNNQTIETKHE